MGRSQRQKVWNHGSLYGAPAGATWEPEEPINPFAPILSSISPTNCAVPWNLGTGTLITLYASAGAPFTADMWGTVDGIRYEINTLDPAGAFIKISVSNANLQEHGDHDVCVVTGGGIPSIPQTLEVIRIPWITSVEPVSVPVNSPDTLITVHIGGGGATEDTLIFFKSTYQNPAEVTTFIDEFTVTALLPADQLTAADTDWPVYSKTLNVAGDPPGRFGVLTGGEPTPAVTHMEPTRLPAPMGEGATVSCKIYGSGMDLAVRVLFDGEELPSNVGMGSSETMCWAHLTPEFMQTPGIVQVGVRQYTIPADTPTTIPLEFYAVDPTIPLIVTISPASYDIPTTNSIYVTCSGVGFDATCMGKFKDVLYPPNAPPQSGYFHFLIPGAAITETGAQPITIMKGAVESNAMTINFT